MNRPIRQREIPEADRPISELYRLIGDQWADADGAANLLEEMKTTQLEQRKTRVVEADMANQRAAAEPGKLVAVKEMPDNRAERIVKASPDWEAYIRQMCDARTKANRLKVQLDQLRMRHMEQTGKDANARHEARLGR